MSTTRGVITGSVALVALYNLISDGDPAHLSRVTGIPGAVAHWLIDPTVPLIPDLRPAPSPPPAAPPRPDGAGDPNQLPGDVFPNAPDPHSGLGPNGTIPAATLPVPTGQGTAPGIFV